MDPYDIYTALIGALHLLRLLDLYLRRFGRLLRRLARRLPSIKFRLRWESKHKTKRRKTKRRKVRITVTVS